MKYERLDFDSYRSLDGINWSLLKSMDTSALQFAHDQAHPKEETRVLRIGSAAHAFVLEPEELERRFCVFEGPRRAGKDWEAFKLENARKIILTQPEWDAAEGAGKAIVANRFAKIYLSGGLHELAVTWVDPKTKRKCKARVDHVGERHIEIKTTARLHPRLFQNTFARMLYHGQMAFQANGLEANGIETYPERIVITVGSTAPHDVVVYRIKPHVIEHGRADVDRLLAKLVECEAANRWPGIAADETLELDLPAWMLLGEEDDIDYGAAGEALMAGDDT